MKRTHHFLAALAALSLLGASSYAQSVAEPRPKAPSPPGSIGAASPTQGTGATGGVTDGGTRATSKGSQLAPGSGGGYEGPTVAPRVIVPADNTTTVITDRALPVVPKAPDPNAVNKDNNPGLNKSPGSVGPAAKVAPPAATPGAVKTPPATGAVTPGTAPVDIGQPDASPGKGVDTVLPKVDNRPLPATLPGAASAR